jgi:CheY-like chemotaxis protein
VSSSTTPFEHAEWYGSGAGGFQELMREQVRNVLFVSSFYESFIMAEDGQINELLLTKFLDVNLSQAPRLTHVPTAKEALELLKEPGRFDLVLTAQDVGDMDAVELAERIDELGVDLPIVLLAYDYRELKDFWARRDTALIDRSFLWQGDVRILLAIVKYIEDKNNVEHDVKVGVPVVIVVEDNVRYYSSFLPVIYTEVMKHSQQVISEGLNLSQKLLRMRARPKILLASSYEEAWEYFSRFREDVLGVISDIEFPRDGKRDPDAGATLASRIREARPDVPIALQSSYEQNKRVADEVGASFLRKGSPDMLARLRELLVDEFFFGDFVFQLPSGEELDRARNLKELVEKLRTIPAESIAYHGVRNDFSSWLRARAEFEPASKLRRRKVSDFDSLEDVRRSVIQAIDEFRRERTRGTVADFHPSTFDPTMGIARIGGGSLGGKARGLAFAIRLLDRSHLSDKFAGIRISVPPAVVLGTDVFEAFLERNGLRDYSLRSDDDDELQQRFEAAIFPEDVRRQLREFLKMMTVPLAVRSSSLLEDSPHQPFAGIFDTLMLSNDHGDLEVRLDQLLRAIKRVYASTFSQHTKAFLKATPYRLEEEQMAVVIQKLVGGRHGHYLYPDFAGVGRSYNYYPTPPLESEEGIVAVALGLGRTVVEGEPCLRFSPAHPRHIVEFSSVEDMVKNAQREFWALELGNNGAAPVRDRLTRLTLDHAEEHGVLGMLGSTYSAENNAVYDGIARDGIRLVTFAPVLKNEAFPLAEIVGELLDIGAAGTSSPVEVEFAVNLSPPPGEPMEFGFLQLRPLAPSREVEDLEVGDIPTDELIVESPWVLGNGRLENVRDVIVVDRDCFDRAHSRDTAAAVSKLNARLVAQGTPYLLIGVGRWGSSSPELGIPVGWDDISGAVAIVEAGLKDMHVTPSQGTHFFQNLASCNVGYFTVNEDRGEGFVRWDWLRGQDGADPPDGCVRHLRFDQPIEVVMIGQEHRGIIRKPHPPE